jgi:hypothetical protein
MRDRVLPCAERRTGRPDSCSTAGTGRCRRGHRAQRPSTAAPRTRIMLDRGDRRHDACAVAEVVRFRALTLDS